MTEIRWIVPGGGNERVEKDHIERYKYAARFVKNKQILDIACGSGYGTKFLKDQGALTIDGIDISEEAISVARKQYASDGVLFHVFDAVTYCPNKTYDCIVSFETIEQVSNFRQLLRNFYEWLAPGGLLIISSINRMIASPYARSAIDHLSNGIHCQEFTSDELSSELRACGFRIGSKSVLGQRQQLHVRNRYLRRIYKMVFKPDIRNSPEVKVLHPFLTPRYLVILAEKPNSHA